MNRSKPNIGVTGPAKGGTAAWLFTKLAVWLQGGRAVRITPESQSDERQMDGLILGGGADIDPRQYGRLLEKNKQVIDSETSGLISWINRIFSFFFYPFLFLGRKLFAAPGPSVDYARDQLELSLLEEAMNRRLPVLGICRGAQLINVNLGGTLHQDIKAFYGEVPHIYSVWPRKEVEVEPDSRLGGIVNSSRVVVNVLHRQAVEELGESLVAVAREKNGLVQAVELPDYPYMIGVQWHPEYLPQIANQRRIFRALVECAANEKNRGK